MVERRLDHSLAIKRVNSVQNPVIYRSYARRIGPPDHAESDPPNATFYAESDPPNHAESDPP